MAGWRWRVEEAFEQAKGEVGLGHYQVHQYGARYRHVRLAIVAHGFLAVTRASVEHLTAGVGGRRGDRAGVLVTLTVPELRRLLVRLVWRPTADSWFTVGWSSTGLGSRARARQRGSQIMGSTTWR